MSGLASIKAATLSVTAFSSCAGFLRNRARTGVLKKRSDTVTVVPSAAPHCSTAEIAPPSEEIFAPLAAPCGRLTISVLETAAIDASASPLKPKVEMLSRSDAVASFDVAWGKNAFFKLSASMPQPLSVTTILRMPPSSIATVMRSAPESIAFSNSSLTTDAGRSITSPAEIRLYTLLSRILILGISSPPSPFWRDRRVSSTPVSA